MQMLETGNANSWKEVLHFAAFQNSYHKLILPEDVGEEIIKEPYANFKAARLLDCRKVE